MNLNTPKILLGEVKSVEDDQLHIITFSIPNYVEGQKALPFAVVDEPKVGDEVILIELDPVFKTSYYYMKVKKSDGIQFNYKGKWIKILESKIELHTPKSDIELTDSGDITIKSSGNIKIDSGKVTMSGESRPGTPGPFCALKSCVFSGAPHTSNESVK